VQVRVVKSSGLLPRHLARLKVIPGLGVRLVLSVDDHDAALLALTILVPPHLVIDEAVRRYLARFAMTGARS
jgi:hypothetical protein